jgi:hypothetical protein
MRSVRVNSGPFGLSAKSPIHRRPQSWISGILHQARILSSSLGKRRRQAVVERDVYYAELGIGCGS